MSQFESVILTYVGGLGASFQDLARAVKTALPHAPMPDVGFHLPYQVLSDLKLSGNCSVGETIRTLVEAGVDHPNMPVVKSYIKESPWDGEHAYRHAFYFSNDMRQDSDFLHPVETGQVDLTGPGYVFSILRAADTKPKWAGDSREKTTFLTLRIDDGDSVAKILYGMDGSRVVEEIKTHIKHLGTTERHYNLAVFDRDWITQMVREPLERQLAQLSAQRDGAVTLDELAQTLWGHLDLIRAHPNPVQKSKASYCTSEEVLPGTYYLARDHQHSSLEDANKHVILYLTVRDRFREAVINVAGSEDAEGNRTYLHASMEYKVRTGRGGHLGHMQRETPDAAVLSRLRTHYEAVFAQLKEEQEPAPPADTPVY